jgi:uncharacterized membrane protein YadS
MVVYPLIAVSLKLSPVEAGLFLGATIHDVAPVVGAGYSFGDDTGDFATVVKLFRVTLPTVVVISVSASFKRLRQLEGPGSGGCMIRRATSLVPWFPGFYGCLPRSCCSTRWA